MNPHDIPATSAEPGQEVPVAAVPVTQLVVEAYESATPTVKRRMLTQLIGQVYAAAPLLMRSRLLEQLMAPLGVLSLVAVANGIFAKIRFRSEWQSLQVRLEDTQNVQVADVLALADHVQQVSLEAVQGLAQMLTSSSSLMASSGAAVVLVSLLLRRSREPAVPGLTQGTPPAAADR